MILLLSDTYNIYFMNSYEKRECWENVSVQLCRKVGYEKEMGCAKLVVLNYIDEDKYVKAQKLHLFLINWGK